MATAKERHREEVVYLASRRMRKPRCELAHLGGCDERFPGDLQSDHVIEIRWMKNSAALFRLMLERGLTWDDLIADARNGWLLCGHHNRAKSQATIRIMRAWLPPSVEQFAADFGLESRLDAHFIGEPLTGGRPIPGGRSR